MQMRFTRFWRQNLIVAFLLGAAALPAYALNDDYADAIAISTLPFGDSETTNGATIEATDPASICFVGANSSQGRASVWYQYTTGAAVEYVNISTQGSSYDTVVNVYSGSPGNFQQVLGGCNDDGIGATQSLIAGLRLKPATTYSIEVISHGAITFGGSLQFAMSAAPIYNVTRSDDPSPALSSCAVANCSLRAAIKASNAIPGAVLIPAGTYPISLGSSGEDANAGGDFDIRAGIGIYGAGMAQTIIDAAHKDRAFDIDPDSFSSPATGKVTAIITDLSIINGGGPSFYGDGGAIRAYSTGSSALVVNDFLALEHVSIRDSRSQLNGGGLALAARGMIRNSEFINNYANSTGGGLTLGPGSIGGDTTIEISGSTISGNQSPSTFSGGGGIKTNARLRISNSTLYGNTTGYHGGAIYLTGSGSLEVRSSTIANNTAAAAGGSANGGGIRDDNGKLTVLNSILANNTTGSGTGVADDCTAAGGTLSASYSVLKSATGCAFTGSNNLIATDPSLDTALANNGGITRTLALLAGSIAVDAADPAGCSDYLGNPLAYDQRGSGFPRSNGGRCDMGAFESAAAAAPTVPGAPDLSAASDSGASNSDNLTNAATLNFSGTCSNSDVIALQVDAVAVGSTVTCAGASYAIASSTVAQGNHLITATATLGAQTSAASTPLAIVVDRSAPTVAISSGPNGSGTCTSASLAFSIDDGIAAECQIDGGNFSACFSPVAYSGLLVGTHNFVVRASDLAGNLGSDTRAWSISPPDSPAKPLLDAGSDTGASNADAITRADPVLFLGACIDGDSIRLYDGTTPIGSASVCASGYQIIVAGLGEGTHLISASATRAGTESATGAALSLLIDRTAPTAPDITSPVGASAPTSIVHGQAEANAAIAVRENTTLLCSTNADAGGNWSCTASFSAGGTHNVVATATDLAGNEGPASLPFGVDVDRLFADDFEQH